MSTTKQRINISLSDEMRLALARLARRDRVPTATKAAHLIASALDTEEDTIWNELAMKRDRRGARFLSHKKAWHS